MKNQNKNFNADKANTQKDQGRQQQQSGRQQDSNVSGTKTSGQTNEVKGNFKNVKNK